MAYDPNIRASDADRDRAASLLREHLAAGRLTPDEFSERLDRAFAAKTVGEIDALLKDLPSIDLYRLPDAALTRHARQVSKGPSGRNRRGSGWRAAWGAWFTVVLVCFVVWGLTGHGYVWPLWVAGPWGAVLAGSWVTSSALRGEHSRRSLPNGHQRQGQLPSGDEDLPGRPGH
ncbi:MAG TPA: DUF1707 domain-containing protein [Streptosporangiaceae bacterium]|nr:DUF1707 domain-containing protein [Streptosporangiaceae bacterium]